MRYITTRGEWEALYDAENKKLALDDFWLAMLKSPSLAKNVIKRYFDQVEMANKLFTTYKEGWKTDMGMLYIILGNPDLVNRTEKSEEWIYEKNEDFPKMKFTFDKVPNIFADNQFVLRREKDFRDVWFKAIDMWRKGRFESIFK
jgi:GWxTD domain-containing protein